MNHMRYSFLFVIFFLTGICPVFGDELINYPPVKDVTLPNGLRLMIIEHHEQPAVCYRVLLKTGSIDEPEPKSGIADLTFQLLQEGTTSRSSEQIAEEVAAIGANFGISSHSNRTILRMDSLSKYSETALDILSDVILNPSFKPQAFKRVQSELVTNANLELTENQTVAIRHGRALLFGDGHPLARVATEKSLKSISVKDVREFYETFFRPNNCVLLVIGDFSPQQMQTMIESKLSSWQKADTPAQIKTEMDYNQNPKIRFVDNPDMTQAVIYLNQWSPNAQSSDYYAYSFVNYIFGGSGFSSRLMEAVRSQGGKTYSIYSFYHAYDTYGTFNILTSTRNEELLNTYNIIQTELGKLVNEGITKEELADAKTYFSGSIPLKLESTGAVVDKIMMSLLNGFTVEDMSKELINYNGVTLDDINAAIKKYIHPDRFNIVILGDEKKIKSQLDQIGDYETVSYKDPTVK